MEYSFEYEGRQYKSGPEPKPKSCTGCDFNNLDYSCFNNLDYGCCSSEKIVSCADAKNYLERSKGTN
jgi:hypothetical protein